MDGTKDVIQNLNVKTLLIGKQNQKTKECEEILQIAKQNNVAIKVVSNLNKINIDKYVSVKILAPNSNNLIEENALNNNSVVAKLEYGQFSMLFTGDIEKSVEEQLIKEKKNELKSTVLKVAHHGSNSSTTDEFVKEVKPQIALIGVGENNKYGHPNSQVLERLKCKIYRTDRDGEISIIVNKKGKMKIETKIN